MAFHGHGHRSGVALPVLVMVMVLLLLSVGIMVGGQQPYTKEGDCTATAPPDGVYGYTCAAAPRSSSCSTYATYAADSNYTNVAVISALLGADVAATSALNHLGSTSALPAGTLVIVPVSCACSANRTRAPANYTVQSGDTYYNIAGQRYHALSTCRAMMEQNPAVPANSLQIGQTLLVPVRCACPSAGQAADGVKYLVTYSVNAGDDTVSIARRFNVSHVDLLAANELSSQGDATIYAFTTLLVPLRKEPSSLANSASPPPPPPPPATSSTTGKSSGSNDTAAIVAGVAAGVVVAVAGFCIWCCYRTRRTAKPVADKAPLTVTDTAVKLVSSSSTTLQIEETGPRRYSLPEIETATGEFSAGNRLSQSVFRGEIDGEVVAVKRVAGDVAEEVRVLAKLSHVNLLQFRGYCAVDPGGRTTWMVFEYAENGSLATWLEGGSSARAKLTWKRRIRIASDVANALNYLHEFANPPYVHRDVCGENVLLDATWRAKLANFGRVRSAVTELAFTSHVVGTRGYLAPEYAGDGVVTTKADVFAFGVLLAQLISGLPAVIGEGRILWRELWALFDDDVENDVASDVDEKVRAFVDKSLGEKYEVEAAVGMTRLARACVAPDLNLRPSMDRVAMALSPLI